jgi:hypothetical protein
MKEEGAHHFFMSCLFNGAPGFKMALLHPHLASVCSGQDLGIESPEFRRLGAPV